MKHSFRGKFLVRKSKTKNNEEVVVICGVFYPKDLKIKLNSKDEMWVADIEIKDGGIRFEECNTTSTGARSPEEFLEGESQKPQDWNKKSNL